MSSFASGLGWTLISPSKPAARPPPKGAFWTPLPFPLGATGRPGTPARSGSPSSQVPREEAIHCVFFFFPGGGLFFHRAESLRVSSFVRPPSSPIDPFWTSATPCYWLGVPPCTFWLRLLPTFLLLPVSPGFVRAGSPEDPDLSCYWCHLLWNWRPGVEVSGSFVFEIFFSRRCCGPIDTRRFFFLFPVVSVFSFFLESECPGHIFSFVLAHFLTGICDFSSHRESPILSPE